MPTDRDTARVRIAREGLTQVAVERVARTSFGRMPITLVDRAISYFSIILFGSLAYVVSRKRRGGLELGAPIEPLRTSG